MMKQYSVRDLREFGLEALIGEACAYSFRTLYDLSEKGIATVENALSIKIDRSGPKNWNSYVGKDPAVASIMLTYQQAHDILVMGLCDRYSLVVVATAKQTSDYRINNFIAAGSESQWEKYQYPYGKDNPPSSFIGLYHLRLLRKYPSQPNQGNRNTHAFTGRNK
jgi:hypothetical protein